MKAYPLAFLCVVFVLLSHDAFAQPAVEDFKELYRLKMSPLTGSLHVDGKLDEAIWSQLDIATDFWQKSPNVQEHASPRTEVSMTYDDKNLYIGAKCYQDKPRIIQTLKRDEFWDSDGIGILLDPLNEKTNCFIFGVSAAGVQMDAVRSAISDMNTDWSNKWVAEVDVQEGYWSAEIKIPLSILRYDASLTEWGLNFVRNATFVNEFHNWTAVPAQFWPVEPAYAGTLVWEDAPQKQKGNYNLIPYVTSSVSKNAGEATETSFDAGLDGRIAITSSLNMDVTFNPDFSQIEVDELVTNLTRFSIFLPEKRTFFLENKDIFSDYGSPGSRPFFSRTIGLDKNRNNVPIIYGLRLSGNASPDVRLGVMNIHTATTENSFGQNNTAISVKKQFGRSFIQGMFLNRQAFDGTKSVSGDYGRNTSLEAAYISEDGQYTTWLGLHHSFKEGFTDKTGHYNAGFSYSDSRWEFVSDWLMMQENYFADMGFINRIENFDAVRDTVIRQGYNRTFNEVQYNIRPFNGVVGQHSISALSFLAWNPDWSFNESILGLDYNMRLKSGHRFGLEFNNRQVQLLYPFSFTGNGDPLPADRYGFSNFGIDYRSDDRKALSFEVSATTGAFYNGTLTQLETEVNYRIQPWGNFSVGYQYNDLEFPDPFGDEQITAWLSKVEIGFSRNLLWTTLFQFVDQSDFMGVNSRLQWRFAPMSDLFLVYVDNYDVVNSDFGSSIQNNNRALILKVNYWY